MYGRRKNLHAALQGQGLVVTFSSPKNVVREEVINDRTAISHENGSQNRSSFDVLLLMLMLASGSSDANHQSSAQTLNVKRVQHRLIADHIVFGKHVPLLTDSIVHHTHQYHHETMSIGIMSIAEDDSSAGQVTACQQHDKDISDAG